MTENPPPPSGTPEGSGSTPPPPQNPYGSEPSTPPPPPQNPYASQPPPPANPYAGNPPVAGQSPYGSAPQAPGGQNPYGAEAYPVTPGPAPVAGPQPAGLLPRFLARFIDGVLIGVLTGVLSAILDNRTVGGVVGGLIYLGYYVYMESNQGHTLGKLWLKMRVHGASGGNPTTEEAFKRNAWYVLGIVSAVPYLGLLTSLALLAAVIAIAVTISQDAYKRGWHDKFANTSVTKEA